MTFQEVVREARRLSSDERLFRRTNPYGHGFGQIIDENSIASIVVDESKRDIIAVETHKPFPNHYGQVLVSGSGALIELAGDANQCWRRFALVKELMHVLHPRSDGTINQMEMRTWLARASRFNLPDGQKQLDPETMALCLAMELLLPWIDRGCLSDWHHNDHETNYHIAKKLLVPKEVICQYFELGYAEKSFEFNKLIVP